MFAVDDIEDVLARLRPMAPNSSVSWCGARIYRLLGVRGPDGIVVALAELLS